MTETWYGLKRKKKWDNNWHFTKVVPFSFTHIMYSQVPPFILYTEEAHFTTLLQRHGHRDIRERCVFLWCQTLSRNTAEKWRTVEEPYTLQNRLQVCLVSKLIKGMHKPLLLYWCISIEKKRQGPCWAVHHLPWGADWDFTQWEDEKRYIWTWRHWLGHHWGAGERGFHKHHTEYTLHNTNHLMWVEGDPWLTYSLGILWDTDDLGSPLCLMWTCSRI